MNARIIKQGDEVALVVKGIFGRNRKTKIEVFILTEVETIAHMTVAEFHLMALAKLREIKARPGCVYRVTANRFEDKEYSGDTFDTYIMRSTLLQHTTVAQGVMP